VLVELTHTVVGRLLPLCESDVVAMLAELDRQVPVFSGLRGLQPWPWPWPRAGLVGCLLSLAPRAQRCVGWATSTDLNPLVATADEYVAVDATFLIDASSAR
jgi:hypothetical protein